MSLVQFLELVPSKPVRSNGGYADVLSMIQALIRMNPEVKIIAASGLNANGSVVNASGAGIKHFLTKPYTSGTLLNTMRAILAD